MTGREKRKRRKGMPFSQLLTIFESTKHESFYFIN